MKKNCNNDRHFFQDFLTRTRKQLIEEGERAMRFTKYTVPIGYFSTETERLLYMNMM